MKPRIMKVIKYDYFSTLLFVLFVIVSLLVIAIIAVGGESIEIALAFFAGILALLSIRVYFVRNDIFRLKDSRVPGKVHRIDKSNGLFYIVINYEVKTRTLGKRIPLFAGPILRAKLGKLDDVPLLVDMEKPKRVYLAQFYYE